VAGCVHDARKTVARITTRPGLVAQTICAKRLRPSLAAKSFGGKGGTKNESEGKPNPPNFPTAKLTNQKKSLTKKVPKKSRRKTEAEKNLKQRESEAERKNRVVFR